MDRITALKFQVEALQKEYLSELGRRESVRASLAVPVAVLSFAAFGFAALANNAVWLDTSLTTRMLTVVTVGLTGLAATLLFAAIIHLAQAGFASRATSAKVLNFVPTADDIKAELEADEVPPEVAGQMSMVAALESMSAEYASRTKALKVENDRNLKVQEAVLSMAIPGFGLLILAVVLSTGLKIAARSDLVGQDGQNPVNDASLSIKE